MMVPADARRFNRHFRADSRRPCQATPRHPCCACRSVTYIAAALWRPPARARLTAWCRCVCVCVRFAVPLARSLQAVFVLARQFVLAMYA